MAKAVLDRTWGVPGIITQDTAVSLSSVARSGRHDFYRSVLSSGEMAFVKRTLLPKFNDDLIREVHATTLARQIGIPVVNVYPIEKRTSSIYKEVRNRGVIALEFLDNTAWQFTNTPRQLNKLKDSEINRLAKTAAEFIHNFSGYKLPKTIDTNFLQIDQNVSGQKVAYSLLDKVNNFWDESRVVLEKISILFPGEINKKHDLQTYIDDAQAHISHLIETVGDQNEEYFSHGDLKPYHFIFSKLTADAREHVVIDFGLACKTQHLALAKLLDIMFFIGHAWPNQKLQQAMIRETFTLEKNKLGPENTYRLLRSAIILAIFYFSKDGMEPTHRDHTRASTLLHSLDGNLQVLDEIYRTAITE